jgi:hypothetical protein
MKTVAYTAIELITAVTTFMVEVLGANPIKAWGYLVEVEKVSTSGW